MQKKNIFFGFVMAIFFLPLTSQAKFWSVSVGLPVTGNTSWKSSLLNKGKNKGNPSGYMLHVKAPLLFGLGVTSIKQDLKQSHLEVGGIIFPEKKIGVLEYLTYDVFYSFDFLVVSATVGAGFGNLKITDFASDTSYSASQTQLFAKLGYSVFPLTEIQLGVHLFPETKVNVANTFDLKVSSNVISLGIGVGF